MADVKLTDASAFIVQGHAKRVAAAVAAVRRTVKVNGPRIVQASIDETSPAPVDRGTYRRSWRYDDLPNGAQITNSVPYASVIEGGRRPGARQPPTEALVGWVKRKGLVKGRGKSADAEARGVAFIIARAIAKRGLPAKGVLKRALERLRTEVEEAVRAALAGGK